jgi:CMP-N-acetylneuraminic acid synthetase
MDSKPMHRYVAIVPMRDNSERVKGKNYRQFVDRPLYHHIIQSLLDSQRVDLVMIDTDSPFIMEDAAKHFPMVHISERPMHLRDGHIAMNDVLLNSIQQVPSQFYIQTHSTNPLLKAETIRKAIDQFNAGYPMYDSLFGVTRMQVRLWDELTRPVNHNVNILLRTQDLPPIYAENSNLYIFTPETLVSRYNRIGNRPLMFDIPQTEAWDLDEESDFGIAEAIYHYNHARTV